MANQRGIVAGWDSVNSRPKGVTSAADLRASLQMIAARPGIAYESGAAAITLPSNAMRVNWMAFNAVIKSALGGWYTPRIDTGGIALALGHATYARIDVIWVRQRDYQTNASWPDSEVEVGVAQGTPSATPSTPAIPTDALAVFTVRVPSGATRGADITVGGVTRAPWVGAPGSVLTVSTAEELRAIQEAASVSDGTIIYRADTNELLVKNGARWVSIVQQEDTGWVNCGTAVGGFNMIEQTQYRIINSVLHWRGVVSGTLNGNAWIEILGNIPPAAFPEQSSSLVFSPGGNGIMEGGMYLVSKGASIQVYSPQAYNGAIRIGGSYPLAARPKA